MSETHMHHSLVSKSVLTRIADKTLTTTILTGGSFDAVGRFNTHIKIGNIESITHKTILRIPAASVEDAVMNHIAACRMILANKSANDWNESLLQSYLPQKNLAEIHKLGIYCSEHRFDTPFTKKMLETSNLSFKRKYSILLNILGLVLVLSIIGVVLFLANSY